MQKQTAVTRRLAPPVARCWQKPLATIPPEQRRLVPKTRFAPSVAMFFRMRPDIVPVWNGLPIRKVTIVFAVVANASMKGNIPMRTKTRSVMLADTL